MSRRTPPGAEGTGRNSFARVFQSVCTTRLHSWHRFSDLCFSPFEIQAGVITQDQEGEKGGDRNVSL